MAYEFKSLVENLKEKGLDVAEDAAAIIVETTMDWIVVEAAKSNNKYDDLVGVFIPTLKPVVMGYIDKIDGADDPNR